MPRKFVCLQIPTSEGNEIRCLTVDVKEEDIREGYTIYDEIHSVPIRGLEAHVHEIHGHAGGFLDFINILHEYRRTLRMDVFDKAS